MEWSPPSTIGTLPASRVFSTSSAALVQVAVISLRYFALAAPSFFCSGMATAMLPASSTLWPIASKRASNPATRTADGPISTPRRDWPRSRGTPSTRMLRGLGVIRFVAPLRIEPVQHSGERDGFPYVFQAADPRSEEHTSELQSRR